MHNSVKLQRMIDQWITDVESFCLEANETLDDLEAYGKEPVLDDDWLDGLSESDTPFYFSTDSLEYQQEQEPEEWHRQLRLNLRQQPQPVEEVVFSTPEAIADVLELAHQEDIDVWQSAIAEVMTKHQYLSFTQLRQLSGLQPVELLVGLLLGHWKLRQQSFSGEIEVWRD